MSGLTLMNPAECEKADSEHGPFVPAHQAYALREDNERLRRQIGRMAQAKEIETVRAIAQIALAGAADQPDTVPRAEYDRLQSLVTAQGLRLMETEDQPDPVRRCYFKAFGTMQCVKPEGHDGDHVCGWTEVQPAAALGDWRPISEAPADGIWALVYAGGAINCAYVQAGKLPEDWTEPACPNVMPEDVTHWMPLPRHPATADNSTGKSQTGD